MPSATSSGANATPNGAAKSRDHNQGNQERKYTIEQKTAVIRVRRCSTTAFYDILGLEEVKKTVSDGEIKKAYRKLSLLTHPDKNGYEGADEAFKMVSRAFQVLSDPAKKSKYDSFGGDPDNRFASASTSSPFSGFARSSGGGGSASTRQGGPMWGEEEISPEEMFNRFFGGGGGGGGGFGGPFGAFDGGGSGFVFNMAGGPGFRVHQFGGTIPRRRPREARYADEPAPTLASALSNLLPLLLLFILPLLSSLFSSSGGGDPSTHGGSGPTFRFDTPQPPHTLHRSTPRLKLDYFLNPADVVDWSSRKLAQLDHKAEVSYMGRLKADCDAELEKRQRLVDEAQGWFFQDAEKLRRAGQMELGSCRRLDEVRSGGRSGGWGGW